MSMSRKDYVYIASALKQAIEESTPAERPGAVATASRVAAEIGRNNANFDYGRFLAAAGVL